MIGIEDILAFQEESEPAFAEGRKVVRRADRGIPADRWTTTEGMHLVADCIKRQWVIMGLLTDALAAYVADDARRFDESVGCFDSNGNRTS